MTGNAKHSSLDNKPNGAAGQNLKAVVSRVLSQFSNSKEARYYQQQYSGNDAMRFAVIKVGGGVLESRLEQLADALVLLRNLGLMPIILHGAGPQLDSAMSDAGIVTEKSDGLRVTTAAAMQVIRPVVYRANRRLVQALQDQGVQAQGIQHGVFQCDWLDQERLGLVGDVTAVDLEAIRDVVQSGALPVLTCLGENSAGQVMNINADIAARELAWAVRPHKIIFLTDTGGLLGENGNVISSISLNNDYVHLSQQNWVHSGMRLKLEQIRNLLARLPDSASVSITSVDNLAVELFTHRGAGTLIRNGESIIVKDHIDEADMKAVSRLLENSFGRCLAEDYFEDLPLLCMFSSQSYGAVAIVLAGVDGIPYLDKFAVTPQARGAGLGASVWQALVNRFPKLYWRSRNGNPMTRWYFEHAGASFTRDSWVAFSRGIDDMQQLQRCREDCFTRPESWLPQEDIHGAANHV